MQTYESVDIGPNQVEYQLFKKKTMTYFLNEVLIFSGNCHRHLQNQCWKIHSKILYHDFF